DPTPPTPLEPAAAAAPGTSPFPRFEFEGATLGAFCFTFLPGVPMAGSPRARLDLLDEVGRVLGDLDLGLADFRHQELERDFPWKLDTGTNVVRDRASDVDDETRPMVDEAMTRIAEWLEPLRDRLPAAVIHNDANDHNLLVQGAGSRLRLSGIIDFGDMVRGWRVAEPAVAGAYLSMGMRDPVAGLCSVARGYAERVELTEAECAVLLPLTALRLCLSIALQARQIREQPDNEYLRVSQAPARALLHTLLAEDWHVAEARIRHATGWEPVAAAAATAAWIEGVHRASPLDPQWLERPTVIDMSVESLTLPHPEQAPNGPLLDRWVVDQIEHAHATVGIGRYCEPRLVYDDPLFEAAADPVDEARTIHIGLDFFAPPGTPVRAALGGTVESVHDNAGHLDYGPTVVIRHEPADLPPCYTLYGHLDPATLEHRRAGDRVEAGDVIGWLGDRPGNGGWSPHLHLQLILSSTLGPAWSAGRLRGFAGVARPSLLPVWRAISPDPSPVSGLLDAALGSALDRVGRESELIERRDASLGPSLSLSYETPLHIVRGHGARLYDSAGRSYLDTVNNVAHVGHSNPRVWEAVTRQGRVLNTNTRYLHDEILALAEELKATLPSSLEVVYLVCSGSEANELALRMALAHTGRGGVVVLDGGYHGNTKGLVQVSPYKFDGPGGSGRPDHVAVAPTPDPYRRSAAESTSGLMEALRSLSGRVGAFLAEPILSCAGQVVPPDGYLAEAYRAARNAGAVCIADEVQVGFGRVGDAFWGFESMGAVPDLVTMGKPMGNGHPVGAVAATRAVAESFANGMEYFNTFGGNPVSAAAARAVLEEIETKGLRERAGLLGRRLLAGLHEAVGKRPEVGDIRGRGLFLGIELVSGPEEKVPGPDLARAVVEGLKRRRVLSSRDGPHGNVIKFKPPMVLSDDDGDRFLGAFADALDEASGLS
ncbi:MAG: aminotransferase class III-fold pyridoxal phosphate-dependent enzyme, partial [Gemmatimonadetes bacterium]|nr:aminotransferase class III-fold pyridoxal phosphate-dependent enzyme [Gemmatimonadota bacterium]